jgi:predicted kinase
MTIGSDRTRLIVLRGNSGAGKSTVAAELRAACGQGLAWVSQDLIRRVILKEKDRPGAVNIGLIDHVVRYCLDHGYHAVLDGILYADRYEQMLARLQRDHLGTTRFYYLDVALAETLRRHATRLQASEFGADDMRRWYRPRDLLTTIQERVIPETSTLRQTVEEILEDAKLLSPIRGRQQSRRRARLAPREGYAMTVPDIDRKEPGRVGDERGMLEAWLDYYRASLLHKCSGLTAEQLVLRSCEPSPLSLAGLIRHMTEMERAYAHRLADRTTPLLYCTDDDPDGDIESVTAEQAMADVQALIDHAARSRGIMAGHQLDDTFGSTRSYSLRWVYHYLGKEYARHLGHADLLRERIDGVTGE